MKPETWTSKPSVVTKTASISSTSRSPARSMSPETFKFPVIVTSEEKLASPDTFRVEPKIPSPLTMT